MITGLEKSYTTEEINAFNKLMIKTIKGKEDNFKFDGKNYMVCSDGVRVQTLINGKILYRIFIEDPVDNITVNNKLLNCI